MRFEVKVKNVPETARKYIVARFDENTNALWFYSSWSDEMAAEEMATDAGGVVVERIEE